MGNDEGDQSALIKMLTKHYHSSGRSWIFLGGGGRNSQSGIILQTFCQKTAWKWNNLDPPGGASVPDDTPPAPPLLGSANA